MKKIFGYCRISRKEQNIERQKRNIVAAYPDAEIVSEAYTGTKIQRPAFDRLLRRIKSGDMIVFDSVSRMARDAEGGWQLYKKLYADGIELVFLKEPHVNTEVFKSELQRQLDIAVASGDEAVDDLINGVVGLLNGFLMSLAERQVKLAFEQAEKEVEDLHQRTREGIETARRNGKQIGQQTGRKLVVKKCEPAKEIIKLHSWSFGGSLTDTECMKLAGLSRNTYFKYKREIKDAMSEA